MEGAIYRHALLLKEYTYHSISILFSTLPRLGLRLEEEQVEGEDCKDPGSGLQ